MVEQAVESARQGSTSLAIERLQEAARLDAEAARPHVELGTIYGRQNRLEESIREFETAIALDGDNWPDAYLNLAVALRRTNRLDEAIQNLNRSLEIDPQLKTAHVNLALIHGQRNQLQTATEHFQRALNIDPTDIQTRFNLAVALVKQQDPQAALAELRKILKQDPDMPIALSMSAELLTKLGRRDEATLLLKDAVERKPQIAPLRIKLAGNLEQLGQPAAALQHYREAERLDRGNLQALMRIGWILSTEPNDELRDGKLAVRYAQRATQKAPKNVAVLDVLAAAYAEAGDFERSIQAAEQAVQIANSMQSVRDAKVMQQRLKLYRNGQPYRTPPR